MDHSDKIKQNLEILGLASLEHLSLDQLSCIISKRLPSDVSKTRVVNIYAMWLHPRLVALDVSTEGAVTHEITTWYRFLKTLGYEDTLIADAFCDWQHGEAMENPTSLRRLSIAEAELRKLIFDPRAGANPAPDFEESESHYGQMHPDRVKLSREDNTVSEADDGESDVVLLSSSWLRKDPSSTQSHTQDGELDLSFLTGSNRLVLDDMLGAAPDKKKSLDTSELSSKKAGGKKIGASGKPRGDYVCDRCGKTGHFFKDCPTNMNPMFDRLPPRNYQCHFCDGVGLHFGHLCPQHPDPDSILRQRHRLQRARRVDKDGSTDTRNVRKAGGVDRSLGDRITGRGRPKSPVRDDKGGQPGDGRLSPEEIFSRLRLSAGRNILGKRKASPSTSSDETASSRKKHQTQADKGVEKGKVVAFPGDILEKRKNREEGRLSYDDEGYGDVSPLHVATRTVRVPDIERMEIDTPEKPVSAKSKDLSGFIDRRLFELDLMEMIETESVKTDLILFINGVERMAPGAQFLAGLFKSQEGVAVNERLRKTRPCPTDYFSFLVKEQEVEMVDVEMAAEAKAATDEEASCVFDGEETIGSAMMLVEPTLTSAMEEGDAEMTDVADSAVVIISSDEEDSVMLDGGSFKIEEPVSHEVKTEDFGVEPIAMPTKDGSCNKDVEQAALPAVMAGKPGGVPKRPAVWKAVDVDLTVSSPSRPISGTTMEVEALLRVPKSPPARRRELFAQAISEKVTNLEMTSAVSGKASAFLNGDNEVIVIGDSSQSSKAS